MDSYTENKHTRFFFSSVNVTEKVNAFQYSTESITDINSDINSTKDTSKIDMKYHGER